MLLNIDSAGRKPIFHNTDNHLVVSMGMGSNPFSGDPYDRGGKRQGEREREIMMSNPKHPCLCISSPIEGDGRGL